MLQVLKVSISKHATLKTEIAERLPMVRGNPAQLKQLIMNLVINASQAIGERKGEIGISVAPAPEGNYLQLEVADTGSGMTDDTKAKIFDPFFTTKSAGRGLGLAVVQGVVRTHGGTIQVVSAHGSGTTFQVLLPCMAKDETASLDFPANGLPAASGAAAGTILIVEDEDALRIAVSKMLRKKGFSVIEAGDGDAGVDRFRSDGSRIGVVVLDMTLPGRSGREVLAELQRIRPGVKVIITSAHGREHVRDSLDGLQPWRYVQKPYQAAELATLLRECLTAGQASATA